MLSLMTRAIRIAEFIVLALLGAIWTRGFLTGSQADLVLAGLFTPLMLVIFWRFHAEGISKSTRR